MYRTIYSSTLLLTVLIGCVGVLPADTPTCLPGTAPLEWTDDLAVRIVDEAHRFLDRRTAAAAQTRLELWSDGVTNARQPGQVMDDRRRLLARILGVVDSRVSGELERYGSDSSPALVAETEQYRIWQVRWPVLDGVSGEGLLAEPTQPAVAQVVAIPDAGQTPEQLFGLSPGIPTASQFARGLAESGFRVLVPVLISREIDFSGDAQVQWTNLPHREWIYRQAFPLGRHVIGFDVQKVLAGVDWLRSTAPAGQRVGLAGFGEGGLVAFYSTALDARIDACLASGYFGDRSRLWTEPIERNVWRLLTEFGDAEVAAMIVPRSLTIEHCAVPSVQGPPAVPAGRIAAAAPGRLMTSSLDEVDAEIRRVRSYVGDVADSVHLFPDVRVVSQSSTATVPIRLEFGGADAMAHFVRGLGCAEYRLSPTPPTGPLRAAVAARQQRQVLELTRFLQRLRSDLDRQRESAMLQSLQVQDRRSYTTSLRDTLRREVLGDANEPRVDPNPRSRLLYDTPTWTGYEVVLDVWSDFHLWGILCIPKGLAPDERRPVVVCQHGLEGLPRDVVDLNAEGSRYYHAFAAALTEQGFVTFAPFHLYRGGDQFRLLQRKAHPLGLSLYSLIIPQHEQLLDWLSSLPFVDAKRIGFYGLSYGGRSALLVPACLERYALTICSGNFNDWIRKLIDPTYRASYLYTSEFEMFEFGLAESFNHAELAASIFPRPFMVERGHHDGVGLDWWVAGEFAKVRLLYDHFNQDNRCEIEYFLGQHEIHGKGTVDFLKRHLSLDLGDGTDRTSINATTTR